MLVAWTGKRRRRLYYHLNYEFTSSLSAANYAIERSSSINEIISLYNGWDANLSVISSDQKISTRYLSVLISAKYFISDFIYKSFCQFLRYKFHLRCNYQILISLSETPWFVKVSGLIRLAADSVFTYFGTSTLQHWMNSIIHFLSKFSINSSYCLLYFLSLETDWPGHFYVNLFQFPSHYIHIQLSTPPPQFASFSNLTLYSMYLISSLPFFNENDRKN